MLNEYLKSTKDFHSIMDFLRFGLSRARAAKLYYGHGTDNAVDDIYALILGALSLPNDVDPLFFNAALTPCEKETLATLLKRRIVDKVPVPYLTHQAYFCGLPFYVDERVLIPRSPIAELIEQQFSPWIEPSEVGRILDICTGSGCIAIACCYAFPEAEVIGVDISTDALFVAVKNGQMHDVKAQLQWVESDVFERVPPLAYDLIISNPPYVGHAEMQMLPDEYRHEPRLALEAEDNGLAIVDNILHHAHHYLSEKGILVVEVGNSEEVLIDAYPTLPFTWLEFERGGQGVFLLTKAALQEHFGV